MLSKFGGVVAGSANTVMEVGVQLGGGERGVLVLPFVHGRVNSIKVESQRDNVVFAICAY